jgi:single-strand DNA-binding protein
MNYNKAIIIGHLTADPELRYTPSGKACANFTIASSRRFRDGEGGTKEHTLFLECVVWGERAEIVAKHKRKGDNVLCEGHLLTDHWEDKATGQKRTKIKLNVASMEFGKKATTDV